MLEEKIVNELKVLALEAINNAGSGHSGSVMSAGDALYTLYTRHLLRDNSDHIIRDRFVLSNGHACAILYAVLSGLGYIDIKELASFRKYGAILTGHPEINIPGVDCATGPLGQGVANAVGMAIAESIMSTRFGGDHYTYCMVGDGCLQEGVAMESLSIAGLYGLNKFILLYDKNNITLDGKLDQSSVDNVAMKFKAMNFDVITCDGHNINKIDKAITKAKQSKNKPSIIILNSIIGKDTDLENSHLSHGKVYSRGAINELRWKYKLDSEYLDISNNAKDFLKEKKEVIDKEFNKKVSVFNENIAKNKKLSKIYNKFINNEFDFKVKLNNKIQSTREANGEVLNCIAKTVENIVVLSADLSSSTKVRLNDGGDFSIKNRLGRNIAVGIREHAMGAIANGIALHGGLIPITSTFLTFSNYMMPAIRMASIMKLPTIFTFTHSSSYGTPDGVTHLPVEQLDQLRLIPNMTVFRPCDMSECVVAYDWFMANKMPMCLCLSRGDLPAYNSAIDMSGAYYLTNDKASVNILSSGSEIRIAMAVKEMLKDDIAINVVSVPSVELFNQMPRSYKNKILNKEIFVIESSTAVKYLKYANEDHVFNIREFGLTGTQEELLNYFGLSAEIIAKKIKKILKKCE